MTMLSRVAERVYWASRYLERVSCTARLISIHQALLFDLPTNIKLSWYNLIIINDQEEAFDELYTQANEQNVVKFLLGDEENSSSLMSSLNAVRENVRTTRDVVPEEAWEMICELCLYVKGHIQQGINRRTRHDFLETVSKGCLQINGLLESCMPHNDAWDFFRIGCHLERSDMTTRYLEAGLTAIMQLEEDEQAINSQQIIWGSVLRSLNATQYYLRTARAPVKGQEVLPYLLTDPQFPKSIIFCLSAMINAASKLPREEEIVKELRNILHRVHTNVDYDNPGNPMLEHLNQLQILLTAVHFKIGETWFSEQ